MAGRLPVVDVPQRPPTVVEIAHDTVLSLRREARLRETTVERLARDLLDVIASRRARRRGASGQSSMMARRGGKGPDLNFAAESARGLLGVIAVTRPVFRLGS